MHAQEARMPSLQVRDLPEELYRQLTYLAARDHRSLAQEAVHLLEQGIRIRLDGRTRRRILLESYKGPGVDTSDWPDPADLIREDRDR